MVHICLYQESGDDWVEIDYILMKILALMMYAYIIQENEETIYKYDWEWLYGALEPGEYQIAISISNDANIYAYFILR